MNKNRFKRYRLTDEQYNQMLYEQQYSCKICKSMSNKALCVDHCHKTGRVRGLLCDRCNQMLGKAMDRVDILQEGINYLIYYGNSLNNNSIDM